MLRVLLTAAVLLALPGAQDMPVARLSGDARAQGASPSVQPPRAAGQLPPLPMTQIDSRVVTLDSPRRLSLTFAEPRPIDEVLALLTAGTPFSVAIDPDATGAFRGELKQLTLREALATILGPLGLDYHVQGTVIRVRRRQLETRLFDLDLLHVQRALARTTGDASASVSTSVAADDVMNGVSDGVKALLSDRGTVHVDKRAGLVQVTDFAERLERVALYVETLQQRSARQVRLQAQAFEVMLRDAAAIDWRVVRERLGLSRDAPEAGMAADPAALRSALALQGDVRVLWAPDVTALNNEPAIVRVTTTESTSLSMTIVPQISADGIVQISIAHAWEEHAANRKERVSAADTVMRILDGQTGLIAGLVRPQEVAVPSTGRFGSIFGATAKRIAHAELVVLLRPTIVTPGTVSPATRD